MEKLLNVVSRLRIKIPIFCFELFSESVCLLFEKNNYEIILLFLRLLDVWHCNCFNKDSDNLEEYEVLLYIRALSYSLLRMFFPWLTL